MPQDIIITPTTGAIQFKENAGTVMANIQLDGSNVLNITGNLSLGDTAANVFIGDGTSVVDVIFEQNGSIRALTAKTLTLGQSDSLISFAANISSNANITGNLTVGNRVIVNTPTGSNVGLNVNGANTQGGTGFSDFLRATNTSGGATNPNKTFRLNSTGGIEVINSAYTVTIFSLSDAGALTLPGPISVAGNQAVNGPAFRAYVDTAQTITSGTQQKVTFGTENFDTNSNFATSRFTPTVAGYYQFNSVVRFDGTSGTGECMIVLYKNGAEYARGTNKSGTEQGANFWSMEISEIANANGSTDFFEVYVQQTSGASRTTTAGSAISHFSGCMLRGV